MKFKFRQAKISDLEEVLRIFTCAQAFMQSQGNPQWPKGFPDENDVRWGILGGILYVVAAENGRIAAVFSIAGYDRDYDEIDGKWLTCGNYLAVHRVAVSDDFRGTGAAKFIVNQAAVEIAHSRGRSSIRMDTHEKNAPMLALLKSQGFAECGKITLIRDDTSRVAFEKIL